MTELEIILREIVRFSCNQAPDEPSEGATEAQVTAYQTARSKYQKADCNAMIILSTNMSEETYEKVRSLQARNQGGSERADDPPSVGKRSAFAGERKYSSNQ